MTEILPIKDRIKKAIKAIVSHFEHALHVQQAEMAILQTGDTALVLANALISARHLAVTSRKASYVVRKAYADRWVCTTDKSRGHALLEQNSWLRGYKSGFTCVTESALK